MAHGDIVGSRSTALFASTIAILACLSLLAKKQGTPGLESRATQWDQAKREKNWNRVVELATRALSEHPDSARAWYRLGSAEEYLGHFAKAQEAFQHAADLNYDRRTCLWEIA